jgi:hypothetical protein
LQLSYLGGLADEHWPILKYSHLSLVLGLWSRSYAMQEGREHGGENLGHFIEAKFVAIFCGAYWAEEQGAHHHVGP